MRSKLSSRLLFKTLVKTPELLLPLGRMWLGKFYGADHDYKRGDGIASRVPRQVSLRITNACNHRCAVCGQYGEKGYMHGARRNEFLKVLPADTYKRLFDDMVGYKPIYYVTGGEPFLYPGFTDLMNYAKDVGSLVTVVTNGVKLKEKAEEIVRNGWDMVLVSFDGPCEVHDKCRGVKGAYQAAVEGIKELKAQRRRQRRKKPYILTSLTLSGSNAPYIEETFGLNSGLMPDLMVVYLSWFTCEDIGRAQARLLKEEFGVDAYTWRSYSRNFSWQEAELFSDNLESARSKKWPFDYIVVPDLKGSEVRDYYLYPGRMFGYAKCAAPFIMADIMPNGDVTTCRDFVDVKVGNIAEEKILEIWNNRKFVKFRKLLIKNGGLLPQCSRCCGLMGF